MSELQPSPCPYAMPVQAQASAVTVGNFPETQAVSGTVGVSSIPEVSVSNWPSLLSVLVRNGTDARVPVSATCEAEVPCVANGQAESVRIVNDASEPVPVGGVGPAWTAIVMVFGIGVVGGLAVVR